MLKAQHPRTAGQKVPRIVKCMKACRHKTFDQAACDHVLIQWTQGHWCMSFPPTGMGLMFGRLSVCCREVRLQYGSNKIC